MFSVMVIRIRSLRLLRFSGIVMRLRMFLLLITFFFFQAEDGIRDLIVTGVQTCALPISRGRRRRRPRARCSGSAPRARTSTPHMRSEERRVGKECNPVLYVYVQKSEISMKDVFCYGDSYKKFKIAEVQWYRYAPSYVSPAYHLLFFSSRRRHTRSDRDWSSDVCSSDLPRSPSSATSGAMQRLSAASADFDATY